MDKKELEQYARGICQEEGLTPEMENELIATIWCESGFNPNAKNTNNNGTIDYGLCQYNDYWYRDQITPYEAEFNIDKAIRLMCKMFLAGRQNDWCCYRFGGYKKYMPSQTEQKINLMEKLLAKLKELLEVLKKR